MTATALWAAVVSSYEEQGLMDLTNIHSREAIAIDTTVGESAAQGVIDLWPAYAQEDYDHSVALHVETAKEAVIAMLWRRGGTATSIEQVKWDAVFSSEGTIARVKGTGARGRRGPSTNSGISQRSEMVNGRQIRGWSDPDSLPHGRNYLPRPIIANDQ